MTETNKTAESDSPFFQQLSDFSKTLMERLESLGHSTEGVGAITAFVEDYLIPQAQFLQEPEPADLAAGLMSADSPVAAMDVLLTSLGQSFVEALGGKANASDSLTPAIMRVVVPYQNAKKHNAPEQEAFASAISEFAKNVINIRFLYKRNQEQTLSALKPIIEQKDTHLSAPDILNSLRAAYSEMPSLQAWANAISTTTNKRAEAIAKTLPVLSKSKEEMAESAGKAVQEQQKKQRAAETKQVNRALGALYGQGQMLSRDVEVVSATTYAEVLRDAHTSGIWSKDEIKRAEDTVRAKLQKWGLEDEPTLKMIILRIALMEVKNFITPEEARTLEWEAASSLSKYLSDSAKEKLQHLASDAAWNGLIAADPSRLLTNARQSIAKLASSEHTTKKSTLYSLKKLQLLLVAAFPAGPKREAVKADFDRLNSTLDDIGYNPEFSLLSGKIAIEPLIAGALFDASVKRLSTADSAVSEEDVANHYGLRTGKAYSEILRGALDTEAFINSLAVLADAGFYIPALSNQTPGSTEWRNEMGKVRQEVIKNVSADLRKEQRQSLVQSDVKTQIAQLYDLLLDAKAKTYTVRRPEEKGPYYLQKDFNVEDLLGSEVQSTITALQNADSASDLSKALARAKVQGYVFSDGEDLNIQRDQALHDIYLHWYAEIKDREAALRTIAYNNPSMKVPRGQGVSDKSQPDSKDRGEIVPGVPGMRPELILALATNFDSSAAINPETWGVIKHSNSPGLIDRYFSMLAANRTLELPEEYTPFLTEVRNLVGIEGKLSEVTERLARIGRTKFDALSREKSISLRREMQALERTVEQYTEDWEIQVAKTVAAFPVTSVTKPTGNDIKGTRKWLSEVLISLIDNQTGTNTPFPEYKESTQHEPGDENTLGTRVTSALRLAYANLDEMCNIVRLAKKVKAGEPYDKTGGLWELVSTDKKIRRKKLIHDAISGKDISLCEGRIGYASLTGSLNSGQVVGFTNGKYAIKDDITGCQIEVYPSQIFQL